MKILLPGMVPPSPNELRRKYRNPHVYAKLRDDWQKAILVMTPLDDRNEMKAKGQKNRMIVQIEIHNSRRYDDDNLAGAQKPILDALKNIGFIHDDSPTWLRVLYPIYFRSTRKDKYTEIDIWSDWQRGGDRELTA